MTAVVITGFMGTGKSSVGRALAEKLRIPFVDTDDLVEVNEGRVVSQIFADDGEAYFRNLEKRAIGEALAVEGAVVATGGGAVLDAENLRRLKAAAPLVCLAARPEVIEQRTREQAGARPLLSKAGNRERIETMLLERAEAYSSADIQIDTSDRDVEGLVDEIIELIGDVRS